VESDRNPVGILALGAPSMIRAFGGAFRLLGDAARVVERLTSCSGAPPELAVDIISIIEH
jgi:hypothetical protein